MLSINGVEFGNEKFKNGESIFKDVKISEDDYDIIRMRYKDGDDIARLLFAHRYIKEKKPDGKIILEMLYVPYSRMDRQINDQVFSLRLMAQILASLKDTQVIVMDPHSNVMKDEFEKAGVNFRIDEDALKRNIYVSYYMTMPDVICMPDKGAHAKYEPICREALGKELTFVYGEKVRNLENKGHIESYKIITDGVDLKDKKVLIIDDICSFGGTAVKASEALNALGAAEISLYITHSEENIFKGDVFKASYIDRVITTDSIITKQDARDLCDDMVPLTILEYR